MLAVPLTGCRLGLGAVGLKEVELTPDGALYLTVLRCVGWLSRSDLATRRREAGPPLPTPGAQGQGVHSFTYALAFDDLERSAAALHRALEPALFPPRAVAAGAAQPRDLAGLEIGAGDVRLVALKWAEDTDKVVVRLSGPNDGPPVETWVTLRGAFNTAHLSDLDERPGPALPLTRAGDYVRARVTVPARDVVTVTIA